jgi:DNA polymerase III delta prime subunit
LSRAKFRIQKKSCRNFWRGLLSSGFRANRVWPCSRARAWLGGSSIASQFRVLVQRLSWSECIVSFDYCDVHDVMLILMAISDSCVSMNLDDPKVVHPFFSKVKGSSSLVSSLATVLTIAGKEAQLSIPNDLNSTPTDSETCKKSESSKHLAEIPETSSIRNHAGCTSLAMGIEKGPAGEDGADNLEVDPNHARRKRQRSNEAEDLLQTKLTATGHIWKPLPESIPLQDAVEDPTQLSTTIEDVTNTPVVPAKEIALPASQTAIPPATKPGKKQLKLNGKGTLGSPIKSAKHENTPIPGQVEETKEPDLAEPKKGLQQLGGRQKRKREPASLVVKLKYKIAETGKSIDKIMEGERPAVLSVKQPEAPKKLAVMKPAPTKPTHPFFKKGTKPPQQPSTNIEAHAPSQPSNTQSKALPSSVKDKSSQPRAAGIFGSLNTESKRQNNKHAPWPWQGTAHVRGVVDTSTQHTNSSLADDSVSKQKGVTSFITSDENVLCKTLSSMKLGLDTEFFQLPQRLVLNGSQIQRSVADELHTDVCVSEDLPIVKGRRQHHDAIERIFATVQSHMTPWDVNRCETQNWVSKYAPKTATHVLQTGPEAMILLNWLHTLKVNTVDTGKGQQPKPVVEKPKKKRKRPSDIDDFIVSESEDELDYGEMTDIEDHTRTPSDWSRARRGAFGKKSKHQVRTANTIIISGPNGCGKSAAVYAVAKELDFEVFEINSGSRRSGKDILDRIGDMAENHLVQLVSKTVASSESNVGPTAIKADGDATRQRNLNAFLGGTKKPSSKPQTEASPSPQREQKQSLILFEEVDVLFQEDKQFWTTVLALAIHSRRPLILTCNKEHSIPVDSLTLHGILRFRPPPTPIATDYLLAIAATEGHLLRRRAVEDLYELHKQDLRASITALHFWCQMGVGDRKGGLDWMLDRWPVGNDLDSTGQKLRSISNNTYRENLDLVPNLSALESSLNEDEQLLQMGLSDWDISIENLALHSNFFPPSTQDSSLSAWGDVVDSLSAADVYCRTSLRTGTKVQLQFEALDPSYPGMPASGRSDVIEGSNPISSHSPLDFDQLDIKVASATLLISRNLLQQETKRDSPRLLQTLKDAVKNVLYPTSPPTLTRAAFAALDPLGEGESAIFRTSLSCTLSSIDREFRVLTQDIAPYVRSIAAYDIRLERARAEASLVSVKRARTTRVARSAVEGVRREEVYDLRGGRKERYFGNELNLRHVLQTGGESWNMLIQSHSAAPSTQGDTDDDRMEDLSSGIATQ